MELLPGIEVGSLREAWHSDRSEVVESCDGRVRIGIVGRGSAGLAYDWEMCMKGMGIGESADIMKVEFRLGIVCDLLAGGGGISRCDVTPEAAVAIQWGNHRPPAGYGGASGQFRTDQEGGQFLCLTGFWRGLCYGFVKIIRQKLIAQRKASRHCKISRWSESLSSLHFVRHLHGDANRGACMFHDPASPHSSVQLLCGGIRRKTDELKRTDPASIPMSL